MKSIRGGLLVAVAPAVIAVALFTAAFGAEPDAAAARASSINPAVENSVLQSDVFLASSPDEPGCYAPSASGEIAYGTLNLKLTSTSPGDDLGHLSVALACVITCPGNITVSNLPNQCGAVVNYPAPLASADCGPVTCQHRSGAFFPVGTTTVDCGVQGAQAGCSFTVTVRDTQPPTISCNPDIDIDAAPGASFAFVAYLTPLASDNCPGVTVACTPASGALFPIGKTIVTCRATDASGNTASCSFTVTVHPRERLSLGAIFNGGSPNNRGRTEALSAAQAAAGQVQTAPLAGLPTSPESAFVVRPPSTGDAGLRSGE